MPENVLRKIKNAIPRQIKICFMWTLIIGIIAHFYKITNWMPNWDSLVFRYDSQNMLRLGRWFLPVVCAFSSFYELPFLNGVIAIVFHALGACFVCSMFKVKKAITAALIGGIVVCFPAVTSIMMYGYVADGYSVAFMLSCLAALLAVKKNTGLNVISVVCIALAAGIYQAYITVTIMLCLLYLIREVIYKDESFKEHISNTLRILICGVLGMICYYVVLKILLVITRISLLDYQGMSDIGTSGGIDILTSLYVIKQSFVKFFFYFSEGVNVFSVLNFACIILAVAGYGVKAIDNKVYLKPWKIIFLALYVVLLPIGAAVLAVINPAVDYHNLMKMGYCVFYLFTCLIYENADKKNKRHRFGAWAVLLACFGIMGNQIVISNISYHKGQMAYEKSYGALIRIADRIEQTEGSENCSEIVVVGAMEESKAYSSNVFLDITGITDGYILFGDDESVGQSVICSALNDYCAKDYTFISGQRKKDLIKKYEVEKMPLWPEKGCLKIEDNIIVIKFGAEGE